MEDCLGSGQEFKIQISFVVRKLSGNVATWWNHLTQARHHEGHKNVKPLLKMKQLLGGQFLSSNY